MTLEEVKALTDDELRIKVALLTGEWQEGLGDGWNGVIGRIDGREYIRCSDYPHDLNACHELEKLLGQSYFGYAIILASIVQKRRPKDVLITAGSMFDCAHATARQRCIAFILTKNATA